MPTLSHANLMRIDSSGDVLRITFCCSEFDDLHVHGITTALWELAHERGQHTLHLDFSAVDFLCSDMLGKLVVLDRKLQDRGGRLVLRNLHPQVYEVFQFTRLTDILDVHPRAEVATPR